MFNKIFEFIKKHRIITSFIIIFLISLIFPFSGDDWQWKYCGWETIKDFSTNEYLNGRYLGNLLVVIMTKNSIIRGLFMATVLTSIVEIIARKTKVGVTFIWTILLCMPLLIFRQSIPWTSGFTNYTISTLFLLIDIHIAERIYYNKYKMPKILGSCLLFYSSCLFIENLTVFLVLATFILNVIYFIKNKKINKGLITIFISTILGLLTMFIHPAYFKVIDGTDTYRTYGNSLTNLIKIMVDNLERVIHRYLIFESLVVMVLISLFMFIYYYKRKNKYNNKVKVILNLLFSYQLLYIIYSIIYHLNLNWDVLLSYTSIFNMIISIGYCIIILVCACLLYKKEDLKEIIIYFILIIGLVAPLSVVTPIGGRNFFIIYVLETMLICVLFKKDELNCETLIQRICPLFLIVLVAYYTSIYSYVYYVNNRRLNYIREQSSLGETNIKVPYLPYPEYIHGEGNFDSEYYGPIYKMAYNLNFNLEFEFMQYTEWLYETQKR